MITVQIAPDGRSAATADAAGVVAIADTTGAPPRPVPGVSPGEIPLSWDETGRSLIVWDRTFPARLLRVEVATGRRTPAGEIAPEEPAGILYGTLVVTPDGRHYLYRCRRVLSDLQLATGLR